MKKKYIITLVILIIVSSIYAQIIDKITGVDKNIIDLFGSLSDEQSASLAYILEIKYKEMLFLSSMLAVICGIFINYILKHKQK